MSSSEKDNRQTDGRLISFRELSHNIVVVNFLPKPTAMSAAAGTAAPVRTASIVSTDEDSAGSQYSPSVTWAIFITWILPVLLLATVTRFAVDPDGASLRLVGAKKGVRPIHLQAPAPAPVPTPSLEKPKRPKRQETPVPTLIANKPSGYVEVVQAIEKRRLNWETTDADPMKGFVKKEQTPKQDMSPPPPRGASSDPVRQQLLESIDQRRREHEQDPSDLFKLMELADILRMYDVQYHDGGSAQEEAIRSYQQAIDMAWTRRSLLQTQGQETSRNRQWNTIEVAEEVTLPYQERSMDGILAALYTSLGKVYFMANMFEKAIASYSVVLEGNAQSHNAPLEPLYLDAMSARGSARIIVGDYGGAGQDFWTVLQEDKAGRFLDVFTGLARVLQAKEEAVPQGWEPMIDIMMRMIGALETQEQSMGSNQRLSSTLNRLYHVLFLYHDVKTKDTDAAWEYLTKAYRHKMSSLPAWNSGMESQKISATKSIFHRGFWPPNVGSTSKTPIFIIGFVRSGSTLLERVLDAHPQIVGTGENSVFNGRLDDIRNKIVETSMQGDSETLTNVIASLADGVVDEMKHRWKMVASAEDRAAGETNPERYVDKMLTNYYNVGFIHMLFPNALILHVAREPMDTIFSAYKHEFPPGPLDYTSEFSSLAELYHAYRDLMEHWDRELPGRVTHVRYEDLVHDMPGVARKIIEATGLEWDDSVLDFHKKKQAVNTLSTTQVRKGIYKDSLQAWRRYEEHLAPLVKLIGGRTQYDLRTTLKGYEPPSPDVEAATNTGDEGNAEEEGDEANVQESNEAGEQEL
jgi:tetratricopeptide (TPR) repeat protein